ncbi:hypothetical protein MTR62_17690 [Novosphingobium sp. 1949]|uniref:Outer membrane assembly lipoprotein YfiO n=1 Tax=Novosphingobium organovorum TaxID=2930092 RepID=A0ABT0BHK2_9SPHN|nr:hypothetical protein [Novosphingobium organovorum]MCJ2184509.1 hypothetical protein [Novosphingobium organovorum]
MGAKRIGRWALGTAFGGLGALALWGNAADASGDYGCTPQWRLGLSDYACAGDAMLGPRNDTRINLAWLMQGAGTGGTYPAPSWDLAPLGHVFLSWEAMQAAYWNRTPDTTWVDPPAYAGTVCQSLASGGAAFAAALEASRVPAGERAALLGARAPLKAACEGERGDPVWPDGVASVPGRAYLDYLKGAHAFYAQDFARAQAQFAALRDAPAPWVAQTARYMLVRTGFAAAQAKAFDEWGWYDPAKVDKARAKEGAEALEAYLAAYPKGRYAASARGLRRRALWLQGEDAPLARVYGGLLDGAGFSHPATLDLIEEADGKALFTAGRAAHLDTPLLLATWDLVRMRSDPGYLAEANPPRTLSAPELAAQAPVFATMPDLYGFLKASYAYHVARDDRAVLALLPDDARQPRYTPLAFSRQMMRGLALERLGDRNTAGFFAQLVTGADPLYQRPMVELALAMHWERHEGLDAVFAPQSPITVPEIRATLLEHVAGPDLLRRQARGGTSALERQVAVMTLLYKDLTRGAYADFGRDRALIPADANRTATPGWWLEDETRTVPVGRFSDRLDTAAIPCPDLAGVAARLAADPAAPGALLCLGEFYRLNEFDGYIAGERWRSADQLGGTASRFPGKAADRASLYARVLAGKGASDEQRAYALYRSVMCYAPSGNNQCSAKDVPLAQRKAWFDQLKRAYPKSPWALKLKYYW